MPPKKRPAEPDPVITPEQQSKKPRTDEPVLEIDPTGEIVFLVGSEEDENGRSPRYVKVNGVLLATASPVFREMFEAEIEDGKSSFDVSTALKLPKDDINATINMFYLIHYQSKSVKLDSAGLIDLYLVCEKYRVHELFPDFFEMQISARTGPRYKDFEVNFCILTALVGLESKFKERSLALVLNSRERMVKTCHSELSGYLSNKFLDDTMTMRQTAHLHNIASANMFATLMLETPNLCEGVLASIGYWFKKVSKHLHKDVEKDLACNGLCTNLELDKDLRAHLMNGLVSRKCAKGAACTSCGNKTLINSAINKVKKDSIKQFNNKSLCRLCFCVGTARLLKSCTEHGKAAVAQGSAVREAG